ncbi:MAG: aminotransferase class IV [Myxococcota bacterium]
MRLAFIDGHPYPPEEARVSVYDRGFLYGDSVFETIRTYGGQPFALKAHLVRLAASAEKMAMSLPVAEAALAAEVVAALDAAGNEESYVRVMISRGSGPLGLDPSGADRPRRVILVEPLRLPPERVYREGIDTICVATVRASDGADHAKLGNYLASLLALKRAKDCGADEALIVDRRGRVVEGGTFNVFMVRAGLVLTPPDDAGILLGVTRGEVIAAATRMGLTVEYVALPPAEMIACDEVFVTSSIREVVPVRTIDGAPVAGRNDSGPNFAITRALHRAFRERVGASDLPPGAG